MSGQLTVLSFTDTSKTLSAFFMGSLGGWKSLFSLTGHHSVLKSFCPMTFLVPVPSLGLYGEKASSLSPPYSVF